MAVRNFVFTLNNPIENGGAELCDWMETYCSYGIIGCETGENGTFHWQGYCELRSQKRFNSICGDGRKWHVERRRGSGDEARDYCKKDGNFVEFGQQRRQGARNDLCRVRERALEDGMRGVTATCNLQQIKVAEKFLTYNEEGRDWETEVIYITGPSGIGKSRMAREIVADKGLTDDCYVKSTGTNWWDGYDGHEAVILDDWRDSWWPLNYVLGLLDRYAFMLEVKGGHRQFKPKLIVITCIFPLERQYVNVGECRIQLERRITRVIDLSEAEI